MIEGLKLDFASSELGDHLRRRVEHHDERAGFYVKQAEQLRAGTAKSVDEPEVRAHYSGMSDPESQLRERARSHERRAAFFTVVEKHIIIGETYRLEESDLERLEFFSTFGG